MELTTIITREVIKYVDWPTLLNLRLVVRFDFEAFLLGEHGKRFIKHRVSYHNVWKTTTSTLPNGKQHGNPTRELIKLTVDPNWTGMGKVSSQIPRAILHRMEPLGQLLDNDIKLLIHILRITLPRTDDYTDIGLLRRYTRQVGRDNINGYNIWRKFEMIISLIGANEYLEPLHQCD
jgi:hypothetical protein